MLVSSPSRRGLLLQLLAIFLCWRPLSSSGQPLTNVKVYSADQQGLLYLRNAIPNFAWYQQTVPCQGWDEQPVDADVICTWDGVGCNSALQVTSIKFPNNASLLEGNVGDIIYGASLIPNLKVLYLANQSFNGMLPTHNFAMPVLEELDLSNNHIKGSLPASWGSFSTFPKLTKLNVAFNNDLSGTLPAAWSQDGSSMQLLNNLELNNCGFQGSLPPQWGHGLPALQRINVSSNYLSGTLPPEWSALNLEVINLDRNGLTGSIPAAWGANGTFNSLTALQLYSNSLSGTLPAAWETPGTMPALMTMDVANNNFSGAVPKGWGTPQSVLVTQDNRFCGPLPPIRVFTCGELRGSCVEGQGISPLCPAPPPDVHIDFIAFNPGDMAALLKLKAAFTNFDTAVRRRTVRWDPAMSMCAMWQGVTCWPDGYVRTITLTIPQRAPPTLAPLTLAGGDNTSFAHASVPQQLRANVSNVLTAAASLTRLAKLDLTNQYLTGYLPQNVSLPSLQELTLVSNNIQGTLPESWAADEAFPSLRLLAMDLNWRISGPLPQTWGNSSGSFRKLDAMSFARCNLTGPLAVSWVKNLPLLSVIELGYNQLSGTLPQALQGMQALGSLSLIGNGINGTLPEQLSGMGSMRAWPFLQGLHLDHNLLSGSLPASWGSNGAMTSLRNISLTWNNLTGSIPAVWAVGANGKPRFPAIEAVVLQPGNPSMCGGIPSGITVFEYLGGTNVSQVDNYGPKTCPGAPAISGNGATSSASSASPSASRASFNTGAIVGIVAGVAALLSLLAALLALSLVRRRRRDANDIGPLHMLPIHKQGKAAKMMTITEPPQHDSDSKIPPQQAPHNSVPMKKAPSSIASPQSPSNGMFQQCLKWFPPWDKVVGSWGSPGRSSARSSLPSARPGQRLGKSNSSDGSGHYQSTLDGSCVAFERRPGGELWLLGQGKFGKVYKGRYLKKLVAIKVLTDNSPEQQEAFVAETMLLRDLRHPHIVQYLGHTQLDGNMLLILEYMQGGNLASAIAADSGKDGLRRLAWRKQGLGIAISVAMGIHYLHTKRVIWFDCKSQNILLDNTGMIAKLSDVGISKVMLNTCTQAFMRGTPGYIAPELVPQLCGSSEEEAQAVSGVTLAVDIYSFGIVMWEIITGENPQKCNGRLRIPRVPEECSAETVVLYQQCLKRKADERPDILTILQQLHAAKLSLHS